MKLEKRNPSAERPNRPEICIEPKTPPPLWVEVGEGPPLLVELGMAVIFVHWTSDGDVKFEERVTSIHCTTRCDEPE